MNNEPVLDIPAPIQVVVRNAHETMVCFSGNAPFALAHALEGLKLEPKSIAFQCPGSTGLDTITTLLKWGYPVYEGNSLPQPCVFFDRRQGFSLPFWTSIPDAFTLACKMVWSQTAAFTLVSGTILSLDRPAAGNPVLLRLAENPHLRLSLPKALRVPDRGRVGNTAGASRLPLWLGCAASGMCSRSVTAFTDLKLLEHLRPH